MLHESECAIQALRWCDHGESVNRGASSKGCSGCVNGTCGAALACMQPDAPSEEHAGEIPASFFWIVGAAWLGAFFLLALVLWAAQRNPGATL